MSATYYSDEAVSLYRADALALLADLPTASVDAVLTDPPYSSGGTFRGDRANRSATQKYNDAKVEERIDFSGDNRDQRAYAYWCALWLGECLRVTKPGGVLMQFTDWRQLPSTTDAVQSGGWVWRGVMPWSKPVGTFRMFAGRFAAQCEFIVWATNGQIEITNGAGSALPGMFHAAAPRDREHATQKPVDVMRQLVKIVPEGGTVLDPFMGSGTTGVAAVLEGRKFIGSELTEHYAEVAERRIRTAAGQAVGKGAQDVLDFGEATA